MFSHRLSYTIFFIYLSFSLLFVLYLFISFSCTMLVTFDILYSCVVHVLFSYTYIHVLFISYTVFLLYFSYDSHILCFSSYTVILYFTSCFCNCLYFHRIAVLCFSYHVISYTLHLRFHSDYRIGIHDKFDRESRHVCYSVAMLLHI